MIAAAKKRESGFATLRDIFIFLMGAAFFAYQIVTQKPENYNTTTLLICGAAMGFPYLKMRFGGNDEDKPSS